MLPTLKPQTTIRVQAIYDKQAKIAKLGMHMLYGTTLFMSMQNNLLDVWDTA